MLTYYVLFDEFSRSFVRSGRGNDALTSSLNYAKHFTSIWSASNFAKRYPYLECFTIKRIVLQ